jgi:hypothetical protein
MTLVIALSLAHIGLVAVLVALTAWRRVFRPAPVFFAYLCFDLIASAAGLAVYKFCGHSDWYLRFFLFVLAGDFLLYFCVLAELGKCLLRFNRKSQPHGKLAIVLFAAAALLIGALSSWTATSGRSLLAEICFLGLRVDSDLQFAGFLALAAWSSLRQLRWSDRELRIATGFGFYTFVELLVSLLQFRWSTGPVYLRLYQTEQAATLIMLAYWLHYFWLLDQGAPSTEDASSNSGRAIA